METELILSPAPIVQHCVRCEKGPFPRGTWSRFHCQPCDIERKFEIDRDHAKQHPDPEVKPQGREHWVTESARIRLDERGWTT